MTIHMKAKLSQVKLLSSASFDYPDTVILYKVILSFEFVDEIFQFDYFNENHRAAPSYGFSF